MMSVTGVWRNRIVRSGEEEPEQLLANPLNYRRHPGKQQEAMTAVLETVGWVQDVIVNETSGMLIDGHMRVELAMRNGISPIPVKYVRLTPEEERQVLATFDPISAMATLDTSALAFILGEVDRDDDRITGLFEELDKRTVGSGHLTFLDDLADQPKQEVSSGAAPERPNDGYVSLAFTLTEDGRAKILEAVRAAKESFGIETAHDALVHICQRYLDGE
jgi:hypothetical protein